MALTDPGPETKPGGEWLEDTLWPETKPMPLYGESGPVTETMEDDLTELANGSTVQESSRQRPRWLG